jgi:hypothetical protein
MKINLFRKSTTNLTTISNHQGTLTHLEQNQESAVDSLDTNLLLDTEDNRDAFTGLDHNQLRVNVDLFRQQLIMAESAYMPCPELFLYRFPYLQ